MNILIADDHTFIRSGLADSLKEIFPDALVFHAENATQALRLAAQEVTFQLAIVDLFMPDMDGFAFLRELCGDHPELPVIVISATDNTHHVHKALESGAAGFISKSNSTTEFSNVVNIVLSGGHYVPPLHSNDSANTATDHSGGQFQSTAKRPPQALLTERQKQILAKLSEGKSNKQIARELAVSENTVKVHVSSILRNLKLNNRTQAGIAAEKMKLL